MKNNKYFKYIVFIAVLLIPFMYSFFYLKSYWDPYGNMDNIPVAIVNLDSGDKGDVLTEKLVDAHVLDFEVVDSKDAKKGLKNKKYYAVITIPEDFTSNLLSAGEENKTKATIVYSPNQKSNYLASQIINRVLLSVENEVTSETTEAIVNNLSGNLDSVPEELDKIEDGVDQILDGSNTLSNGIGTLDSKYKEFDNGVDTLYEGSNKLNNGMNEVSNGIDSLANGANKLDQAIKQINAALENQDFSKLSELNSGINSLNTGAQNLDSGLNTYLDGSDQINNGVLSLNNTLVETKNNLNYRISVYTNLLNNGIDTNGLPLTEETLASMKQQIMQDTVSVATIDNILNNDSYKQLILGAEQITAKDENNMCPSDKLRYGSKQVVNGTEMLSNATSNLSDVETSLNTLKATLVEVQKGTSSLNSGVDKLKEGNTAIANGTNELNGGLKLLQANSKNIRNALALLDDGSNKLNTGLYTLKSSVNDGNKNLKENLKKLDGIEKFASNPVDIEEVDVGKVDQYGMSFTPLFLSIGLWVGALMSYVVLYFDQEHRFGLLDKENKGIKQNFAYIGIAAIVGLVTAFLIKLFLGFDVTSVFAYYFGSIVISVTFMSIIQFLIRVFGDVGKFLSLIILVLQLAASGGTFPVETISKGFRWLTNLLPMTYSINLVKEAVISIDSGFILKNMGILFIFMIICIAITNAYDLFLDEKDN